MNNYRVLEESRKEINGILENSPNCSHGTFWGYASVCNALDYILIAPYTRINQTDGMIDNVITEVREKAIIRADDFKETPYLTSDVVRALSHCLRIIEENVILCQK